MTVQERDVLIEPWFSVTLKGKRLGEDMLGLVNEIEVEDEEDKLPVARLSITDPQRRWINDKNILKGTTISIKMGHKKNNREMFSGRITVVSADFPETGDPTLVINAIDLGVKLMDERKARSFKKAKVSDVVTIMLKEAGIKGVVMNTGATLAHIPQEKESNLEFITRWRKKLGWSFYKEDGKNVYYFGKHKKNSKSRSLGYKTGRMEIISFTPDYQEYETSDEKVSESDIDEKGGIPTYTVRNTKGVVVYNGKKDPSKPVGKA